jgi:acyl dehydratase
MLDYAIVKSWAFEDILTTYTVRDAILYALGIGLAVESQTPEQLQYVVEKDLQVVPTMATVLGSPGPWLRDPTTGVDSRRIVHGEQRLSIYRPLRPAARLIAKERILAITDKGRGRGAVLTTRRDLIDRELNDIVAQSVNTSFLRGDGGYSETCGNSDAPIPRLLNVPSRAPDTEVSIATLPFQALLFRLNGDCNALHYDLRTAQSAGYQKPILHGLCTFGIAVRALLQSACSYDSSRIRAFSARFTAPVYPGETILFQLWKGTSSQWFLRGIIRERAAIVLDRGTAEICP